MPLYVADKVGPLNIEILLTLVASGLGFAWLAVYNSAGLFTFSAVFGFFAGAITTLTAVIDTALCPSLDVVGVRMGMLLVPWSFGLLIGEPIAGAILALPDHWAGLQIFTGTVLFTATVISLMIRFLKYGKRLKIRC